MSCHAIAHLLIHSPLLEHKLLKVAGSKIAKETHRCGLRQCFFCSSDGGHFCGRMDEPVIQVHQNTDPLILCELCEHPGNDVQAKRNDLEVEHLRPILYSQEGAEVLLDGNIPVGVGQI